MPELHYMFGCASNMPSQVIMWCAACYSAVSYFHVVTERAIMCTVQSHGSSQGYSHKMSAHSVENLIKSGNPIVSSKFMDCLFLIDEVSSP